MANALAWVNAISSDILTGLFAWWKMNEGTGSTTADSSGNGFTATFVSSPTWTTGPTGNGAINFASGANLTAATVSDFSWMENTGIWTVNFWFKFTDFTIANDHPVFATTGTADKGVLVGFSRPSPFTITRMWILVRTASGIVGTYKQGTIGDNNWHMATFISNSTTIQAFLDTVAVSAPGSLTGTGTGNSAHGVNIAKDDGGGDTYSGTLDDLRVYNVVLSSADMTTLFNNGAK